MRFFAPSGFATQQWTYDSLLRLTGIPTMGITYQYGANNDDGKITSMTYTAAGYAVNYTYDALGRLATANTNGNQWGLSYLYDGFGNRLQQNVTKAGPGFTPPSSNLFVDPNTNRVNSWTYDANGNATNIPGVGNIAFDWANRVTTVGSESYGYDPGNKRLWKNAQLTLWGGHYEEIGRFELQWLQDGQWALKFKQISTLRYFDGRKLQQEDRLGSANGSFYPFGEEITSWVGNPADKFATYYRDSTGLDYASQRYYHSATGRFASADPYGGSVSHPDPSTWNRFGYVEGDPISSTDPSGLASCWLHHGRVECIELTKSLLGGGEDGGQSGAEAHYQCEIGGRPVPLGLCELASAGSGSQRMTWDPSGYIRGRWMQTRAKWEAALRSLSSRTNFRCQDEMRRANIANNATLSNHFQRVTILNGFSEQAPVSSTVYLNPTQYYGLLQDGGPEASPEYSVGEFMVDNYSRVAALSELGGPLGTGTHVWVNPVIGDHGDIEANLLHEIFHHFGRNDDELFAIFGVPGNQQYKTSSISDAIRKKCL